MLPPQPPPAPAIELFDAAVHQEWLHSEYSQVLLKQLVNENLRLTETLLASFTGLNETQVKCVLQQIKTQRNIIQCLTKPIQLPKPQ